MTIRELRAELAKIDPAFDSNHVVVWLPGSVIDLGNTFMFKGVPSTKHGGIMIEGNVRAGSALDRE